MVRGGSRGRKKPSLRALTRALPDSKQSEAVSKTLVRADSPIVTAILGVGILEAELEPMIRQKLRRRDDATWEKITEDIGPLSSFHSKIVMAYALGIIDEVMSENLHIARRVRNVFAHAKILIDFTEDLIRAELRSIELPKAKRTKLYRNLKECKNDVDDPRYQFVGLCFTLGSELVRKQTSSLKAQNKRLKRRIQKMQLANQRALFRSAGLPTKGISDYLEAYGQSHTSDPKTRLGPGLLSGFPAKPKEKKDNEDK